MATIRNAITMQDKMSPVFNKMNRAMETTLSIMKKVNASANSGVSSREFRRAEEAIMGANNALIKYQNNLNKARQETNGLGNSTSRIGGSGLGAMNAYALVSLAQQGARLVDTATDYLDQMSLMQSRVSMINDGMQTTNQLQDNILASANRARSSYKDTVAAVTKLNMLAGDQFKSNDEAIKFVETLNKMFTVSGTSSQEATAAMYQLTQAMGAGKLQGDEFRSIMENAPMLAQAIAKSMGKSKAELKELSSKGEITADIIKKAMTEATDDVEKKFAAMPMTFGQKMTILKNNFMNTMEPVAARFSQWLNSSSGDTFFNSLSSSLVTLSTIGIVALEGIGNALMWIKSNFAYIEPVILSLITLMMVLGAQSVIAATKSTAAWIMANLPLLAIIGTIVLVIYIFNYFGISIVTVIDTVITWIGNLINVLSFLMPVIIAVGIAILAFFVIPMIISAISAIPAFLIALGNMMMGLWATIQILALYIAEWLITNWVMLLVAIAIGVVIYILIQLGVTAADVIGFIVGLFYMLMAVIYNVVVVPIYNQFAMLANFLRNLFIDPIGAIQMLFLDMATYIVDKVRWVAQALQDLVNMIPGVEVNIVGNLDNIKAAIDSAKADVSAKRGVKQTEFKEYKNVGQSFNTGFTKGHNFATSFGGGGGSVLGNLMNDLKSKFKMPSMPKGFGMDKGMGMFNPSKFAPSADGGKKKKGKKPKMPKGLSDKLKGGKLDKIGKIEDDVKITDEDIKMLKDISKAEFINKYTTLQPNMKVEFTGPITKEADINKIIEAIEDMTEEALSNTLVEGA
ncbi:tape measure protein [Clostridium baratii]|uniref:tape measure protein n=1 Tax=Clostridium baratii TaxID=1561 RepID=UPI0029035B72|nr:tape measure protein [Clostridium baratii]MDU1053361.1 tape measure protein [Clostridium baratii]